MDMNDMMRSQRVNPDSLPLADGGGSGASRKPAAPAPAPKPSKDERAPDVVADTSRLAPYFPRTSLENRPASSSAALVSHHRYNVAMHTSHSQGPNLGGGIVSSDSPLPLQWWGHGKRSRSRREAPVPTPAPEPELTRAEVRRRASLKFRSRKAAKVQARAEMPPPGARGPNLSAAPSPPPRAGTLWLHGSGGEPNADGGEQQPKQELRQQLQRQAWGAEAEKLMPSSLGTSSSNLCASSPIPPVAATLALHRYPVINPDSLSLTDGGCSSVTRKKAVPTPAPSPSKDERDKIVVVDTSCLAPYFANTSLDHQMPRGRPTSSSAALGSHHLYNVDMHTSQGPNVGGVGGNDIAGTSLEQHRSWGQVLQPPQLAYSLVTPVSHHLYNVAMHTSQGPNIGGGGGNGIAAPDAIVPLQWGHRKRSRSRRDAPAPSPAPQPELTPAKAQEEAVKPMLSSGACDPNLVADQSLPPRAVTLSLRSSAEELHNTIGEQQPTLKVEKQQPTLKEEKVMPLPSALDLILSTISPLSPHAATLSQHSTSEEPHTASGEKQQPAPKGEREPKKQQQPQRQESIKATEKQKGKAPMVEVPPHVEEKEEKAAMARPVVPRIVKQLTHEEKEEDWLAMTGTKLPRLPNRRPEIVQKQVTKICPGQRLSQVNRIRYRIKEMKSKKGVGGLKGMAMEDEDSD